MRVFTSWGRKLIGSWFIAVMRLITLSYFGLKIQVRCPPKMTL